MSSKKLPILSELEELIKIDYEYYNELIQAGVSKQLAYLRATFRYLQNEYNDEKSQYKVQGIIGDVNFDEYWLTHFGEHSKNFSNKSTYIYNGTNRDKLEILKKMDINCTRTEESLTHFSNEELEKELKRRVDYSNNDFEDLDLDFSEIEDDLDESLSEDLDDELEDCELDEDMEDYDTDIFLACESPDSMSFGSKILDFIGEYCMPLGGYITTKKFEEVLGCSYNKYKPVLDELIRNKLVIKSDPMHNHCKINCYSLTAKGYRTLSEIYLVDDLDKSKDYYDGSRFLVELYSKIKDSPRVFDALQVMKDEVSSDNLKGVKALEKIDDIISTLDKPVSKHDFTLKHENHLYSYKYNDAKVIIQILVKMEKYVESDVCDELIDSLIEAYAEDTRSLIKYMRVISLNQTDPSVWFKEKTACSLEAFLGEATVLHEAGLEALIDADWLEESETGDMYRVTELGKKYLKT